MKGIILAGGTGKRLWPITEGVSKQLLHVHDKPMIYYPLSTLMLAGIREIAMITTEQDNLSFKRLLGDGSTIGINIKYFVQQEPNGIAEAFILCEDFIGSSPVALILGDNIFHGQGVGRNLRNFSDPKGAHIFAYQVNNPQDFGVVVLNDELSPIDIVEKPTNIASNLAVPGLYFYNSAVTKMAKLVKRSMRGELEITSLNLMYLENKLLEVSVLSRGIGEVIIAKHRNGELGTVKTKFIGQYAKFAELDGWNADSILQNEYGKQEDQMPRNTAFKTYRSRMDEEIGGDADPLDVF